MYNRYQLDGNPKHIPMCGEPASGGCALWRQVLTMEEAAQICGVHRSTLTRFALAGDLITHLIGERRLVDEKDLAWFIEKGVSPKGGAVSGAGSTEGPDGFSGDRICVKKEKKGLYICPRALTVKAAALAIRIHWTNLAKFVASGELKSVKLGAARRVFEFDLWVFFENRVDEKHASYNGREAC